MYYINSTTNTSGNYGNPMGQPFSGCLNLPDALLAPYIEARGFVTVTTDGDTVTAVETNQAALGAYLDEYPDTTDSASTYIPTPEQSSVVMMRSVFSAQVSTMDDDQIIQCSGLADTWTPGDHKVGEVYNAGDQTWECYQAYNNDVYPDIKPSDPSWYTFNRPLHGKSPETARPFVPVQGSHDMYRSGEYMIYTDGKTYRCKSDTNFSPDDYAQAWEVYTG